MRRIASKAAPGAAALLAATALSGCMQASTYGTGERPAIAMFSEVMGGLGKTPEEPIDYTARAPLVMPPSATAGLPQPVDVASAETGVNWPGGEEGPEGPRWGDENSVDDVNSAEYRRLRPLGALATRPSDENRTRPNDERGSQYDILDRDANQAFSAAVAEVEGIPDERRYLTDPPDAYRDPAATAPTEFEDIKRERGFFLTRWLTGG